MPIALVYFLRLATVAASVITDFKIFNMCTSKEDKKVNFPPFSGGVRPLASANIETENSWRHQNWRKGL
jgi:hypothetical protein